MPGAEASEDTSEVTTTILVIIAIIVVLVALAAGSIGFMLGRCCSSMKPTKSKKDDEDTCIFHEKLPREGVRARSMPGRVLITKHGKKFHTSAECNGLQRATSKLQKYKACKVCARPWSESSDSSEWRCRVLSAATENRRVVIAATELSKGRRAYIYRERKQINE